MIETLISFISLILICVLAYFSTKYFAKSMSHYQKSESMQIMETLMLDKDKRMMIVKVQSKYYTLVTHSHGVENLGECDSYVEKKVEINKENRFDTLLNSFINKGDKHESKE